MDDGKGKRTRRRMSERVWREVLARFEESAMTAHEFCRREGLMRSSFYRWRSRLGVGSRPGAADGVGTGGGVSADLPSPKPAFVDLGSLGRTDAFDEGCPLNLRIELGGGISVHLVRR